MDETNVPETQWCDGLSTQVESGGMGFPITAAWADDSRPVELLSEAQFIVVIEKEGVFRRLEILLL